MRYVSIFAATFVISLAVTPAHAFQCPVDIKKIDAALAKVGPAMPAETKQKVQSLRDQGEKLHNGGDHGASVKVLAEALKLLGQ